MLNAHCIATATHSCPTGHHGNPGEPDLNVTDSLAEIKTVLLCTAAAHWSSSSRLTVNAALSLV